jgi:hypothetical protein
MKTIFTFITCLIGSIFVSFAQSPTLNTLKAPTSPAGFLVGINSTEIPVFSDKTKLATEISNKTNGYTELPKSFAFDLAPFLLFRRNNLDSVKTKNLNRNFLLSFAFKDSSDNVQTKNTYPQNAQLAFGGLIQFNFKRKRNYREAKSLSNFNQGRSNQFTKISNAVIEAPNNPRDFLYTEGIKMALSGGTVMNQTDAKNNHSAVWLSVGSHFALDTVVNQSKKENQLAWIFMAKCQKNAVNSFQSTLDKEQGHVLVGLKLSYNSNQTKRFFMDIEGLIKQARFSSSPEIVRYDTGNYKFDLSMGIELSKNLVLTATVGKDFGSEVFNKSGSLFTFLNLAGGIGRTKKDI